MAGLDDGWLRQRMGANGSGGGGRQEAAFAAVQ